MPDKESVIIGFIKLWTGRFRSLPPYAKCLLSGILAFIILFFLIDAVFPVHTQIRYSKLILSDEQKLLNASLSSDHQWRMKAEIQEVNPLLIKTLIAKEDRWFRLHPGVNPLAFARALWQNIRSGQRVSGASTITMQVIRMLEPRDRTVINKLVECIKALQLELHYSKNEILELYINLLPYGGNIQGVKAASFLYFGQEPQALSLAQIVTLAIIPNDPNHQRLGINNDRIVKERNLWLMKLSNRGVFDKAALDNALIEPLTAKRLDSPKQIPHLARLLSGLYTEKPVILTFINSRFQDFIENTLSNEVKMYRGMGVGNAAVVLIDNRNHAVIAYVGSAGFMENQFQGQVDGASALRSPGSA